MPEQTLQPTDARQATLPAEHGLATSLRAFGPIGLLSMFVIFLPGNVRLGEMVALPVSAWLVLASARLQAKRRRAYIPRSGSRAGGYDSGARGGRVIGGADSGAVADRGVCHPDVVLCFLGSKSPAPPFLL